MTNVIVTYSSGYEYTGKIVYQWMRGSRPCNDVLLDFFPWDSPQIRGWMKIQKATNNHLILETEEGKYVICPILRDCSVSII